MVPEGAPAADVAEMVVAAIDDDRPYVFTDPTRRAEVEARFATDPRHRRSRDLTHPAVTIVIGN